MHSNFGVLSIQKQFLTYPGILSQHKAEAILYDLLVICLLSLGIIKSCKGVNAPLNKLLFFLISHYKMRWRFKNGSRTLYCCH